MTKNPLTNSSIPTKVELGDDGQRFHKPNYPLFRIVFIGSMGEKQTRAMENCVKHFEEKGTPFSSNIGFKNIATSLASHSSSDIRYIRKHCDEIDLFIYCAKENSKESAAHPKILRGIHAKKMFNFAPKPTTDINAVSNLHTAIKMRISQKERADLEKIQEPQDLKDNLIPPPVFKEIKNNTKNITSSSNDSYDTADKESPQ
jgi:hypothetical protein